MLRTPVDHRPFECWTFGSECDGGFAQFTVAPARETHAVRSDWSDEELAALPCAYSTAENMLHRAAVGSERVLVTGASGGVGLAAVQLAKRRGATVIAVCSPSKAADVMGQGADQTVDRGADLVSALGRASVDVVIDLVGGAQFSQLLDILRRGGRYAISGAIGGPIAEIDLRTLYLRDLSLFGCTFQEDEVFEDLIDYVERGEVRPVVARTYPLAEIASAQEDFLAKEHSGSWCSSHPVRLLDQAPHVRRSADRGQRTGGRGIHGAFGRGGWRGPTRNRRRTRGPRCDRAAGAASLVVSPRWTVRPAGGV
jgi:NADPH:quinone reductase-like Zn-dependent oxidoreductase